MSNVKTVNQRYIRFSDPGTGNIRRETALNSLRQSRNNLSQEPPFLQKDTHYGSRATNANIGSSVPHNFKHWALEDQIDYIVVTHHEFARCNSRIILDLANEILYRHGNTLPQKKHLTAEIFLFLHDFLNCMENEEHILFANIKHLKRNKNRSQRGTYTTFGLIKEWIGKMQKEHQATSEKLKYFEQYTNGYLLPTDASYAHKLLFEKMKELEADFVLHVYLESKILFPKALQEDGDL